MYFLVFFKFTGFFIKYLNYLMDFLFFVVLCLVRVCIFRLFLRGCPSNSCIYSISTPDSNNRVANVCRNTYDEPFFVTSAFFIDLANTFLKLLGEYFPPN